MPFAASEDGRRPDASDGKNMLGLAFQEMELLGPEKTDSVPVITVIAESLGIAVRIMASEENLIYKVKMPLREDSLARPAIGIGNDSLVAVTVETTEPEAAENHAGGQDGSGTFKRGRRWNAWRRHGRRQRNARRRRRWDARRRRA